MVDFAIKSEFMIDAAITKVYSETTELQKREIERLQEKYIDAKLNFEKGVDMFLVLSTIQGPQKAYSKLGLMFAKKLEHSKKMSENAVLRQSLSAIIYKVMEHVKSTFFEKK